MSIQIQFMGKRWRITHGFIRHLGMALILLVSAYAWAEDMIEVPKGMPGDFITIEKIAPKPEKPIMAPFITREQEARYLQAAHNLRCVVCQNQSIADSNSPEAADMRKELEFLVLNGHAEAEIGAYFVKKYGQRVSYTPPLDRTAMALWAAPFVMVFMAAVMIFAGRGRTRSRTQLPQRRPSPGRPPE